MHQLTKAIEVLNQGGIVIFPTDTAFGIGCRLDRKEAIKKLYDMRKRPEHMPMPLLISSIIMGERYLLPINSSVRRLMHDYWPGGLTVIYKCRVKKIDRLVRGGGDNIGLRMPDHPLILSLIKEVDVPILGSSANIHGEKTPYQLKDINPVLIKLVDYILPGECKVKKVSTVLDCSSLPWQTIRIGAVKIVPEILNAYQKELI